MLVQEIAELHNVVRSLRGIQHDLPSSRYTSKDYVDRLNAIVQTLDNIIYDITRKDMSIVQ